MKKRLLMLIAFSMLFVFHAPSYAAQIESLGVDIHGFVSQGFIKSTDYDYLANDAQKGSFQFNEMGINFSNQIMDNLRIGAQFFSRDLGDVANNKVTLDWAYGDYRFEDWLGVWAGRIKLPLGLYNDTRDMDMLRACVILPQGIYNELLPDAQIAFNGGGLYGNIPLSAVGSIEYNLFLGVGNMDPESGFEKQFSDKFNDGRLSSYNTDMEYLLTMRWNTLLQGLGLKASLWHTPNDMPITSPSLGTFNMSMNYNTQVYSVEFIWKDLTFSAEYQTAFVKMDATAKSSAYFPAGTQIYRANQRTENYYIMGSYRFIKWLEAGAYYMEFYPDASHSGRKGDDYTDPGEHRFWAWQKDIAVFTRFDINSNLVFKVEGHFMNGTANVPSIDNPIRNDKNWSYFAAKATFSF